MFRVDVDTLEGYFAFDTDRAPDLRKLDTLIARAAPGLKRYLHKGTPAGEPGMRFKMIGYGRSFYRATTGQVVEWPIVGVALQKNYVSVYVSIGRGSAAVTDAYAGRLGETRMGHNNFSFERFDQLDTVTVAALFSEVARISAADPGAVAKWRARR